MRQIINYFILLFTFEKLRTWRHGAYSMPPTITQSFWDELVDTRNHFDKMHKEQQHGERQFCFVDSTNGTGVENFWEEIGPRPKVPDSIRYGRSAFFIVFCITLGIVEFWLVALNII